MKDPSFDPRNFGHKWLGQLVSSLGYESKLSKSKNAMYVRRGEGMVLPAASDASAAAERVPLVMRVPPGARNT